MALTEAEHGDLQIVTINGRDVLTVRDFFANKGQFYRGHEHLIDHRTYVPRGEVELRYEDDTPPEYHVGPAWIDIAAKRKHTLTALVDNTHWQCMFFIPEGGDAATLSMEL